MTLVSLYQSVLRLINQSFASSSVSSGVSKWGTRSFCVRALMYVCGRNERMALDLLGIRNPLWRARSICFPNLCPGSVLGYVTSPWEHFLWILFINISKKPINYCLASVFILLYLIFFFSREHYCWGSFQQVGEGGVIVLGLAVCLDAVDFAVDVFPVHFWQSGEVGGSCFVFCFSDH